MKQVKDVNEYDAKISCKNVNSELDSLTELVNDIKNTNYKLETAELRYILDENCHKLSDGFNKSTAKLIFHGCDDDDLERKVSMICKEAICEGEGYYDWEYYDLERYISSKESNEKELGQLTTHKFKTENILNCIIECAENIGKYKVKIENLTNKLRDMFQKKYTNTQYAITEYKNLLMRNDFKIINISSDNDYTVEIYARIKDK